MKLKFLGTPSGKPIIPCVVVDCLEFWGSMVGVIMGRNTFFVKFFETRTYFVFGDMW